MHSRTSRVVASKWLVQSEPAMWVWYTIAGLCALALVCTLIVIVLLCLRCRKKKKLKAQANNGFYDEPPHSSKFRKPEPHHPVPLPPPTNFAPLGYGHGSAFRPPSPVIIPPVLAPVIVKEPVKEVVKEPTVTSVAAQAAHIQQTDTWSNPAFQIPEPEIPIALPPPPPKKDLKKVHVPSSYRPRERAPPPPRVEETDFETTEFETTDAEPIRREIINYVPPTRVEREVHLPARVVEVPVYEESPPQYVVVREQMTESQYQQMLQSGGPDVANHIVKRSPQFSGGGSPQFMPTFYG